MRRWVVCYPAWAATLGADRVPTPCARTVARGPAVTECAAENHRIRLSTIPARGFRTFIILRFLRPMCKKNSACKEKLALFALSGDLAFTLFAPFDTSWIAGQPDRRTVSR